MLSAGGRTGGCIANPWASRKIHSILPRGLCPVQLLRIRCFPCVDLVKTVLAAVFYMSPDKGAPALSRCFSYPLFGAEESFVQLRCVMVVLPYAKQ